MTVCPAYIVYKIYGRTQRKQGRRLSKYYHTNKLIFILKYPSLKFHRLFYLLFCYRTDIFCPVSHSFVTDLLREPPGPEEESKKTSHYDRQYWQNEQTISFTNILDPSQHCIKCHCHAVLSALWRRISIPCRETSLASLVRIDSSSSV